MNQTRHYGSGSGMTCGFCVEVRTTFNEAQMHPSGFLIEREWKRVPVRVVACERADHNHFQSGKVGEIPVWNYNHELDHLDLMNFEAAYTLAAQVGAQVWNGGCVETRLVEVEVTYNYSARERSIGAPISLSELRRKYHDSKMSAPTSSDAVSGQTGTPRDGDAKTEPNV